jgi:uncharacterized membrane protein (DUF485 family)
MSSHHALAARRWRVAIALTIAVMALYFGFIALIAFNKEAMGTVLAPGLTVGILFGAIVIVASWLSTWIYVGWANRHYDAAVTALRNE